MAEKEPDDRSLMQKTRDRLRAGRSLLSLAMRADPVGVVASIALGSLSQLANPIYAVALKTMVDGVSDQDQSIVSRGIVMFVIALVITRVSGAVSFSVRMRVRERTSHAVDLALMDLAGGTHSLEHFERPIYADKLELLRSSRSQLGGIADTVVWNVASLVQILVSVGILTGAHPALVLLPLFGIPAVVVSRRTAVAVEDLQEQLAEAGRTRTHLFKTALSPVAGKETRIFGLGPTLLAHHDTLWREMDRKIVRVGVAYQLRSIAAWSVFAFGYLGAIALVLRDAVEGRATPGDVVLAVTLAATVRQQVSTLYQMVMWATQTLKGAERYQWLRDHAAVAAAAARPAHPRPAPTRLLDGIVLDHVTFRYPGTETAVLSDVSVRLPAGSTVAIVGDNGAGKSTLVKLLARYYDPDEGRILVDGVDLRELDVQQWRQRMSAGFQDFAKFELIAREVVGVGDLSHLDDEGSVIDALERASALSVTDELPLGLDSLVGRSFEGGLELSGGQWQKLALGRAMMRAEPTLLLLDEPTAALDAPSEHALFEQYAGAARRAAAANGAITVLVSHRFSTVRMADLILVLDGNEVREAGSHAELMGLNGIYAELYDLQARAYR